MLYKSLSLPDVRRIYGILDECRERWDNPVDWQQHLLQEAAVLIGLPVGLYTELLDFESGKRPRIHWLYEQGWRDPEHRVAYHKVIEDTDPAPFSYSEIHLRFRRRLGSAYRVTCTRADLIADDEWRRCHTYRTRHKPARMTEVVYSAIHLAPGEPFNVLAFGGDTLLPGDRERQILELLHQEIVQHIGTRLATVSDVSRHGLSPRLLEIMDGICAGLAEKEIADKYGLSRATVSEHIQRLYRHFEVRSRPEFMAYLLERKPRPR